MRLSLTVLAASVLAACQQGDVPATAVPAAGLTLVAAPGGLSVEGSGGREIGFGRDQSGALQSVAKVEGRAPRLVPCGTGREAFATAGGLRLVFEDGGFVGWGSDIASAGRDCG